LALRTHVAHFTQAATTQEKVVSCVNEGETHTQTNTV
jgi:hypothetical protein